MIAKFVLFSFLAAQLVWTTEANAAAGTTEKKDARGVIYEPAIELVNSQGQKVLVVGMAHTGFSPFYSAVNSFINSWVQKNGKNTLVLREFFTCTTAVYDNDGYALKPTALKDLEDPGSAQIKSVNPSASIFAQETDEAIAPLLKDFGMQKHTCEIDVDNKTFRPGYYVRRNKSWCGDAAKHGGACQWLSFDVPDSKLVENVNADLRVDQWPAGMQFEAASLFFGFNSTLTSQLISDANTVNDMNAIAAPGEDLVLNYRTQLLMDQVFLHLHQGQPQIVIPWGDAHVPLIYQALIQNGFRPTKISDIVYLRPGDIGKWDAIDQAYNDPQYPISDHYSFQDPR